MDIFNIPNAKFLLKICHLHVKRPLDLRESAGG